MRLDGRTAQGPATPQWMYVIDALTGIQEDVNYFIPLPGEEPASGYWVYAQCVR
jgi:hypothetical protein